METWMAVSIAVLLGNAVMAASRIRRKTRMVAGSSYKGRGDYEVRTNWAILWVPSALALSFGMLVYAPWPVALPLLLSSTAAPLVGFPPLKRTV